MGGILDDMLSLQRTMNDFSRKDLPMPSLWDPNTMEFLELSKTGLCVYNFDHVFRRLSHNGKKTINRRYIEEVINSMRMSLLLNAIHPHLRHVDDDIKFTPVYRESLIYRIDTLDRFLSKSDTEEFHYT